MAGDDGPVRAVQAAERLDRGIERGDVRRLRWALRAFDLRLANLFIVGRPVRLTRQSQAARERYLASWAGSRFALRRAAFGAFKRILCLLAYATPTSADGTARNPRLDAIGYRPALEPVTATPTAIERVPIGPAQEGIAARFPVDLEADVVVVGSGAGGGVVARDLAAAGRSVLVIEAGPLVKEPDMPTDELAALDRLFLQGGLAATSDGSILLLAGASVGGGTTVNWATCLPPSAATREEWAQRHGVEGFDGPDVEADLEVLTGDLGLVPPPNVPPKDAVLLRGARALGLEAEETRRNAVDCGDCGSCPFGCRRGSKRSTSRVHLAEAVAHGARILPDTTVDRVTISAARVTGVEATAVASDGSTRRVRVVARQVVVAAGALRTPGILDRSAVGHPALGRFLRIHPTAAILARYPERIEMWRGTMQAARSLAFQPDFVVESVPGHPGLIALAAPWQSAQSHADDMRALAGAAPLIAISRDADWGRVTPLLSGRSRVDYRLSRGDVAHLRRGLVEMARIARAAGAEQVQAIGQPGARWRAADGHRAFEAYLATLGSFDFAPFRGSVFSAHQMGTARMGSLAGVSVCDGDGRVRWSVAGLSANQAIWGLYVADSSLFVTAIGVNPMLTVMLLARRVARTVLAEATAAG